jgi:hypothetical protein
VVSDEHSLEVRIHHAHVNSHGRRCGADLSRKEGARVGCLCVCGRET